MKESIYIVFGVLMLIVIGCDTGYYSQSYSFEESVWTYDNPKSFTFDINDTSKVYDMTLTVNHTDLFPYQNLYLETVTTFPADTSRSQLLSLEMANEAGFWFGECSGSKCKIAIPIQSQVHFQEIGEYQLELSQHTRMDSLNGVSSITLRIDELQ